MSEKNRRILLVIILIMTVIWAGYNYPFGSNRNRPGVMADQVSQTQTQPTGSTGATRATRATRATSTTGAAATPSALDTLPVISKAELAIRDAQSWPRDPFYKRSAKKITRKKQVKRSFKLKAIIYNEDSPSAYLNGRVVREGELISGATVIKISPNSVTLRIGQEYQKIKLK